MKKSAASLLGLLDHILDYSNVDARHLDTSTVEDGQPSAGDHRSLHVLVAEDNRINQLLTVKILERRGHRVVVANDGKEALRTLEQDTFDLVLMDLQLPEMGGLATTAAIRAQEQSTGRHLPIVAMSGHVMRGDRERCLDGGLDGLLPQPISAEGLIQIIEALAPASVDADASRPDDGAQTPAGGDLRNRQQDEPDHDGMNPRDLFDPAPILASVEGDEEVLRQVVQLFSDNAQAVLSEIRDAIERQDTERLTSAAHALQAAVTTFGAQRALDAAQKMESLGRHKDLDGARDGLGWLEDEVNHLRHALLEFVTPSDRCVPTDAERVFRNRATTLGEQESSRILIVDHDQDTRRLMRQELERDGYLVEAAADGGSAIEVYRRTSPDIVLMDAHMPDMDGVTACSEIRKQPGGTTIPILIMMSLDDDGSTADAFHAAGATDYLTKPLHWAILRHRLRGVIEASRAQQRIDHLAHHDALTGLPNRLLLLDRLQQALARARRYKEIVAVVNVDLNGFKHINDTMGHEAGDQLLMGVARRLVTFARDSDTVARFGGDEFVFLIGTASERGVGVVARHILDALSKPFRLQHGTVSITTSIGAALFPTDGTDMKRLLAQADTAKHRAKRQGRNVFQFFSRDTAARISSYEATESTLRAALEGGECSIRYRPVVDSTTTEIVAAEAIVSWPQPELAALPATALASLAETSGLITTFQAGLLERVCVDIADWQRPDRPPFRVALSLSARPLMQSDFVDMLRRILTETGLDPALLELDLSDATLMQNPAQYLPRLGALKALGVRLAVSEFGAGCSSLSYLRRCPIERLKIAPSLIGNIPNDEDDAAIVTTIIGMAHNLGLRVIADGVTAEKQLKFLRKFLRKRGCEAVQGDYVGRAVRAADVTRLIGQRETRSGALIVDCPLPYSAWTRH